MIKAKICIRQKWNMQKEKTGPNFIFWNSTLSFYISTLLVHIIVIILSTDGKTLSLATTQQDIKEEKSSKKSPGFLSFIVNNLLISSPHRETRQAKEIAIPLGGIERIISEVQKLWKNFELSRESHWTGRKCFAIAETSN